MSGTIQLGGITLATESGGVASIDSSVNIKGPLNASGSAPIYACRAWVNFRGTSQSGTATASGLVSGQYTATVTSASQFTVVYSGTTYTINTSGDHEIGDGEGVDLTVSGTTVTIGTQIRASGNVSSITDNTTGDYTVNFTTAMPDAAYASVFGSFANSALIVCEALTGATRTTSQLRVIAVNYSSTKADMKYMSVAIFR